MISPPDEPYANGGYIGIGPTILWDKRNSLLTPTKNFLIEAKYIYYFNRDDSNLDYSSLKFDARKYFDLKLDGNSVLAFQFIHESSFENTPIQELPKMGGDKIARGFVAGRFRDKNITQFQVEMRQHLFWRLGVTAFGQFGEVYKDWSDIAPENIKSTVGLGLRFNINRKDPANVRIDFGKSLTDGSNALYFTFGESF